MLNQTIKADEIIVVDDGSSNETAKVVEKLPVRYVYQENKGISSARNLGIKLAKSKIVAFLDDDDEWLPNKIEEQLPYHDRGGLFSHTEELWIRDGKSIKQKKHHKKPDGECFYENISFCKIAPSTVMIEKSLFESVGFFDEEMVVCEDFDMWLRVLRVTPVKLVKTPLTKKYAGESEQLSFKHRVAMDKFRVQALIKHLPDKIVFDEIEKKLLILENGAKKYDNKTMQKWIEDVRAKVKKLTNFSGNLSVF